MPHRRSTARHESGSTSRLCEREAGSALTGGSGLGLAIAASVAQAHGGTLTVLDPEGYDADGGGVEDFTVEVALPCRPRRADPASARLAVHLPP